MKILLYNHLTGYKYDILFEKMTDKFYKSKLKSILPKKTVSIEIEKNDTKKKIEKKTRKS